MRKISNALASALGRSGNFSIKGSFEGSTRLGTPNLERAALGTAKTELGTAFQLQPLGTAKKAELGLKAEQVLYII